MAVQQIMNADRPSAVRMLGNATKYSYPSDMLMVRCSGVQERQSVR